jgi:HAE1 family hydrophobic/amphiphilic exporter-1
MMGLIRTAALRPVAVSIIYIAVTLFGLVALRQLAVDLLPEVDVPRITITTQYEGVSPEEIETLITRPIEQATSTVQGVTRIEAVSSEGLSRVQLQFDWGTKLETALDDVRVAVDRARSSLPEDAQPPSVHKFDLSSVPIAFLGLTGAGDQRRLKYMAENDLARALERLPGVASVEVQGGEDREIRVSLNAERLSALEVSAQDVVAAVARENRTLSAGDMRAAGRQVVIRTAGEFTSPHDIDDVVVTTREARPVRVKDLGVVVDSIRRVRSHLFVNGEPGIRLRVFKQSGANTVEAADALRGEITRINRDYAGRAHISVLWDSSEFIRAAVGNVEGGTAIGGALAVIVLLFFLRSVRATAIVAAAIPLSVIATFGLMHFRGMTLNVISFGGLALGIGMLVDGAIVMLENIHRKRGEGLGALEASVEGAREVAGAVVAGTLTTVAVFVPVVFLGGFAGVIFGEMAEVVTFSLFCSLLVAVTLVPMLATRVLARPSAEPGKVSAGIERGLSSLEKSYGRLLTYVLAAPWAIVVGAVVLLGASVALLPRIGVELMPDTDEGRIETDLELPVGTPLDTTRAVVIDAEKRVRGVLHQGELENVISSAGPSAWWHPGGSNQGEIDLMLVPASKRKRHVDEIVLAIRDVLDGIPGAKLQIRASSSNILKRIVRHGEDRMGVEIRGHDLETADALAAQVVTAARTVPGITFARPDREMGQLERVLHVDRARAAELGLGSADVAAAVETYVLGSIATRYREGGDEFDIRVQLDERERSRLDQLGQLPIVSPTGTRVALSSLVQVEERLGPSSISRLDQQRSLRVNLGTAGRPISEIAKDLNGKLATIVQPDGFDFNLTGELAEQEDTFTSLLLGILLACFLVYACMAVQFESVKHPLVVMASVPVTFSGVVGALLLTGTTLNMNSMLGTIVLVGIAVNNAIVLVDYTNLLRRERGMDVRSALIRAGGRRIRPILMTTLTTLLGLVPLALGSGEGSEMQAPLARAVIGGLTVSTLVTLVLVPCVYLLVEGRKGARRAEAAQRSAPDDAHGSSVSA